MKIKTKFKFKIKDIIQCISFHFPSEYPIMYQSWPSGSHSQALSTMLRPSTNPGGFLSPGVSSPLSNYFFSRNQSHVSFLSAGSSFNMFHVCQHVSDWDMFHVCQHGQCQIQLICTVTFIKCHDNIYFQKLNTA